MRQRRTVPPPEAPKIEEKGLPVSIDAERYVLAAILVNDDLYVQAEAALQASDFSLEKHRCIFQRMGDARSNGLVIDYTTVWNELTRNNEHESSGGLAYLTSLTDGMPSLSNIDSYIRIVKEKSTLRKTIVASQALISRCMLEDRPSKLQVSAEEILMALGEDERDGGPQTLREVLADIPGGVNEFLDPTKRARGLETPFVRFNEMTGGLYSDDLIILAARPSMGKTALALNIADYVACKLAKKVMIFSLEMSKRALLERMVCGRARVDSQRFRLGYLNSEERAKLLRATRELADAPLLIDDKSAATAADMHARIRREMAKGPLGLVIVDYLQLMSAGKDYESKNQEVTAISRSMKLLAKEIHAPMLVLSQLSRAPELRKGKPRPQLSDLRESGSLEQDADVVAFIFRQEVYDKDREDLRGQAELILAKQRNGPVGTINLVFLHNLTKFENRAEDIDEPAPLLGSRGKDDAAANYE